MVTAASRTLDYAANLRRLMARDGLTVAEVRRRTGLNHRTIKGLLAGRQRPRSRTLNQLAAGLNVPVEELFQDPALLRRRLFDRRTNPVVDDVIESHPQVFHGWTESEFGELYSRFGTGGALTREGTLAAAEAMNRRRDLLAKATLLLETSEAEVLETLIDALYRKAVIRPPGTDAGAQAGDNAME